MNRKQRIESASALKNTYFNQVYINFSIESSSTVFCNFCYSKYDFAEHMPKITDCNKTVCLFCLESRFKISENKMNYACYFDHREHSLNSRAFKDFPNDLSMMRNIQYHQVRDEYMKTENKVEEIKLHIESEFEYYEKLKVNGKRKI